MSGPAGSQHWMYASGGFYDYSIENSVRMTDADDSTLQWTAGTPSSSTTWTMSFWIKRWNQSTNQGVNEFFSAGTSGSAYSFFSFVNDYITHQTELPGARNKNWENQLWRDLSGWYHFVFRADLNEGTQANRLRMYVNGVEYTAASDGITQSTWSFINASGVSQNWGGKTGIANGNPGCDHYLADINFCDGQSYAPTEFAETKNGIWVPKDTSGLTFGNNGYRLEFKQTGTGQNASGIGADTSGNDNHFAVSGLDAYNVMPDSPTNNFATINPQDQERQDATKNLTIRGNLDVKSQGNTGYGKTRATFAIPTSGKWYWEMRCTNTAGQSMGILNSSEDLDNSNHFDGYAEGYSYRNDGQKKNNGTASSYGDSWTNGDNIGVLVDADAGEIFFYKNGTIQNSGTAAFTGLDMSNNYMPIWADRTTSSNSRAIFNFGQDSTFYNSLTAGGNSDANGYGDFQYTVPTGALALCSANLPELDIGPNSSTQADDHFNTVLYTGDGTSSNAITGVGFQPDFVWIKRRNNANNHFLNDSVRGATKDLTSDSTDAETTNNQFGILKSFDSDGFTVSVGSSNGARANTSGGTFVGWNWKAGGTAVSNTSGSITSSVSANQDAGFSIVSWTGTATAGTIGHGLSSAPEMIIVKNRDTTGNWHVYHKDITDAPTHVMYLNLTNANTDQPRFNDTTPTNTVFSVNDSDPMNKSGDGIIAYCFHSSDVCKVGSYVGNGNADGTFVFTGFRPAWVMTKEDDLTSAWMINDNQRDPINVCDFPVEANSSDAEPTGNDQEIDMLSNGFKIRNANGGRNAGGSRYIYLAFAEAPFKYANAR